MPQKSKLCFLDTIEVLKLAATFDVDRCDPLELFLCELLDINSEELYAYLAKFKR